MTPLYLVIQTVLRLLSSDKIAVLSDNNICKQIFGMVEFYKIRGFLGPVPPGNSIGIVLHVQCYRRHCGILFAPL